MKIHFVDGKPVLWAGTEASFDIAVQAQTNALQMMTNKGQYDLSAQTYDGRDGLPAMISKRGDVGILQISGSLVDGEASYGRYFGVVGYDDITAAAARLYADPEVKKVLVRIDSPGGMVDGIMDAGETLKRLSKTKTSMVHTSSLAASGGYWLATSIDGKLHVGPTAQVGSIGVVSVHTDLTGAYEQMGVKKTVLRSGENKARINSLEPLTPELKASEERKMADVHNIFRTQVAAGRPGLDAAQLLEVTDGSTFMGKHAVTAGLADSVATFERALKLLDSQILTSNTASNPKGASMKLSEDQIAKLQAGVPVEQLGLSAEDLATYKAELDQAATTNKVAEDAPAPTGAAPTNPAAPATAPPETSVNDQLVATTAQVSLLTTQLAELTTKFMEASNQVKTLTDAAAPLQAAHDSLLTIARASVGRQQVALMIPNTAASMDATTLAAAHTELSASILEKYKVGGVSKPTTEAPKQVSVLPLGFAAAVKSAPSAQSR